jgi:hypothetical protein
MEEEGSYFLNPVDGAVVPEEDDRGGEGQQMAGTGSAKKSRGIRNGLFRAASFQDKVLEKYKPSIHPSLSLQCSSRPC